MHQIESVSEQLHPAHRADAERRGERLWRECRDQGSAFTTKDLVAPQRSWQSSITPHSRAGVLGGRMKDAPLMGQSELSAPGLTLLCLFVSKHREQRGRVEVQDLNGVSALVGFDHSTIETGRHRHS